MYRFDVMKTKPRGNILKKDIVCLSNKMARTILYHILQGSQLLPNCEFIEFNEKANSQISSLYLIERNYMKLKYWDVRAITECMVVNIRVPNAIFTISRKQCGEN